MSPCLKITVTLVAGLWVLSGCEKQEAHSTASIEGEVPVQALTPDDPEFALQVPAPSQATAPGTGLKAQQAQRSWEDRFDTDYELPPLRTSTAKLPEPRPVSPEYPFWPGYQKVPMELAKAQPWRDAQDIIAGWDWSLPPEVAVSPRSSICLTRRIRKFPQPGFQANPVISIWFYWSQVEPEEDRYDFGRIYKMIQRAESQGYGVILRPITAVWERILLKDPENTPRYMQQNCAPAYLIEKYGLEPQPEKIRPGDGINIVNFDPANPIFHQRYLKMVRTLGATGLIQHPAVKGVIVGYKSHSWGDEGIGPRAETDADKEPQHVVERLDAWAEAARGVEHKICMGGASEYGFSKGFGMRGGFVEMYLYRIPSAHEGQYLDEAGYLHTEMKAPLSNPEVFYGDENEEYEEKWTGRFGSLDSFTYRYFTATLRYLQMGRNYILHNGFSIYPEMLAWASLQMGKTLEEAPEVWCALRESYISERYYRSRDTRGRIASAEEREANSIPIKNFERGLLQRDRPGYETEAVGRIEHAYRQWMTPKDKQYDHVARQGEKIGFLVDAAFGSEVADYALKISYHDRHRGHFLVKGGSSMQALKQVPLSGDRQLKTVTLFLDQMEFDCHPDEFDLVLDGEGEAIMVSFVRLIKR